MACGVNGHVWEDDEDGWSYFGKGKSGKEEDHKGQTCRKCGESQLLKRNHSHQNVGDMCALCGRGSGRGRWR